MKKLFLCLASVVPAFSSLCASPVIGGEITYRRLNNTRYELKMALYRDCSGSSLNDIADSNTFIYGGGYRYNLSFQKISIEDISVYCKKNGTPCVTQNGQNSSPGGVERHTYLDTVDFSVSPYDQFISNQVCQVYFTFSACCRPSAMVNGGGERMVLRSMLNLCVQGGNSSVQMNTDPFFNLCQNQSLRFGVGGIDSADWDSLSYSLVPMERDTGLSATYDANYKFSRPITPFWPSGWTNLDNAHPGINPPIGFYFDKTYGDMWFAPTSNNENTGVAVEVSEWRRLNGVRVLVGFVRREHHVTVSSCPGNNSPTISGPYNYSVCQGNNLCFNIIVRDMQFMLPPPQTSPPPDSLDLSWNNGIPGASFTVDSTTTISPSSSGGSSTRAAHFCWTPGPGDTSLNPYKFVLTATDNACGKPSKVSVTFSIWVKRYLHFKNQKLKQLQCGVFEVSDTNMQNGYPVNHLWELQDSDHVVIKQSSKNKDILLVPYNGRFFIKHTSSYAGTCPSTISRYDTIFVKNCSYTTLTGKVWADQDTNCVNGTSETLLKNKIIKINKKGIDLSYVDTDSTGTYRITIPLSPIDSLTKDTLLIQHYPRKYWFTTLCHASGYLVEAEPDSVMAGLDFPSWKVEGVADLGVKMTSFSGNRVRIVDTTPYLVTVRNVGTKTINPYSLFLKYDIIFKNLSATVSPVFLDSGLVKWNMDTIKPDSSVQIRFMGNVSAQALSHSFIKFRAYTDSVTTAQDTIKPDNKDSLIQEVIRPYDPNDKQSLPEAYITPKDKQIDYLIRFQNVGSAAANRVVIIDTIDQDLLIPTVRVLASSHPAEFSIRNRVFTWTFNNINLPDSASDPRGSQGFVRFSISLDPSIPLGRQISNKAAIYFDYESPVITPVCTVEKGIPSIALTSHIGGEKLTVDSLSVISWQSSYIKWVNIAYTTDEVNWHPVAAFYPADSGFYNWIVPSIVTATSRIRISSAIDDSVFDISQGYLSIDTAHTTGIPTLPETTSHFSLYPNPFTGSFTVQYSLSKAENMSFELYDMMGRLVYNQNEGRKETGMFQFDVEAGSLPAGIYYGRLTIGNKVLTGKLVHIKTD